MVAVVGQTAFPSVSIAAWGEDQRFSLSGRWLLQVAEWLIAQVESQSSSPWCTCWFHSLPWTCKLFTSTHVLFHLHYTSLTAFQAVDKMFSFLDSVFHTPQSGEIKTNSCWDDRWCPTNLWKSTVIALIILNLLHNKQLTDINILITLVLGACLGRGT